VKRRTWRYVFFALAIIAGFAAGLGYGWAINPVQYTSTSPETLRIDYLADYVLMVAELYHAEGDLAQAQARLKFLGDVPPMALMNDTLGFAQSHQYAAADLQLMRDLAADLQQALNGLN
jgi:hypothetical protein